MAAPTPSRIPSGSTSIRSGLAGGVATVVTAFGCGFVVLPKCWIIERTMAWLGRRRRRA